MNDASQKWKTAFIALVVMVAFVGLGVRLAFLHLGPNEALRQQISAYRMVSTEVVASRGRILDRRGETLAMDLEMEDVWADPEAVVRSGRQTLVAAQLARFLQLDQAAVLDTITKPNRRYEMLKRGVPRETTATLRAMNLPGLHFNDSLRRTYPHQSLMCHVVGFVNYQRIGSAGIEQRMHGYLQGAPGVRVSKRDARLREIPGRRQLVTPPLNGADVRLTLDMRVQYIAEKAIEALIAEHNAEAAWAVVQRVRTGEILAMVSRPDYDLNRYSAASTNEWRNRAVRYNFEPGSTFKLATMAAAINERAVSPADMIDCEQGVWRYRGPPLHDTRPHGMLTAADVLKYSSNIGTAKIALRLGEERLHDCLREFGFGRRTGIDLPAEERGLLAPLERWTPMSITRIAIGHEVAVTAVQMVNFVNTIANRGLMMRPYVVDRVEHPLDGVIYRAAPEVIGRPFDARTAAILTGLMRRACEPEGTGAQAAAPGMPVAGKTGTAQKLVDGRYSRSAYYSSFAGFVPADDPRLSIIVVADSPRPRYYGGTVAAPAFREIAENTLRYLASQAEPEDPVIPSSRLVRRNTGGSAP